MSRTIRQHNPMFDTHAAAVSMTDKYLSLATDSRDGKGLNMLDAGCGIMVIGPSGKRFAKRRVIRNERIQGKVSVRQAVMNYEAEREVEERDLNEIEDRVMDILELQEAEDARFFDDCEEDYRDSERDYHLGYDDFGYDPNPAWWYADSVDA